MENYIVLGAYTIVLALIGYKSYSNIQTRSDFFIASKSGSVLTITGSLVATILGGSAIIGAIDEAPNLRWAVSWFMISAAIGLFAVIPFAKRISQLGRYTLPDLLESLHGKHAKLFASIIIPIAWIGIIAAQIIAASRVLQSFVGLDYSLGVIISGIVFILYTYAGGQFSVLKTDFLQAILILIGLIVLTLFASKFSYVNHNEISIGSTLFNANFRPIDLVVLILTFSTTFTTGPDIYSRLFCAKNLTIVKKSLVFSGIILIPVAIMIGYIGVFGVANNMQHNGGLLLVNVTKTILPSWAVSVVVVALLSAVLSSAATPLLSASIIVTDLIQRNGFNQSSIRITRISILAIGSISMLISLLYTSIIGILLFALAIYAGAFTLPIILGLLNFRFKPKFVSAAILMGGSIAFAGKLCSYLKFGIFSDYILIGSFLMSGVLLFIGKESKKEISKMND